jgi:flagellar motor switch protein FliM
VPDVLEQSEIDALLAAAEAGELPGPEPPSEPTKVASARDVQAYDFKRPERVSKEQMRALEGIHESFARNLGASLSASLRTIVEVRVATAEQLTYNEFIHSLPNPTNFNVLTAEPMEGRVCLELSPLIIYPIIDRLMGGSNSELYIPQRPLTLIEQRLIRRITDRALTTLSEAWADLIRVEFKIAEVESNPHLVQMVAPSEIIVALGFEVKMGGRAGTMSICYPFRVIEPVMGKLLSRGWLAYQRRTEADDKSENIARGLGVTSVELITYLAETTITVRELLGLQPGDIVQTAKPVGAEVVIQVEDRNKFAGVLGRHQDHRAIRITRFAEVEEKL